MRTILASALFAMTLISCALIKDEQALKISNVAFGEIEGQSVDLYTLSNASGMQVKISNYGATVTSIVVPDSQGNLSDVAAGFNTLDGYFSEVYQENRPYFGGIIGRYASFIKNSQFTLDDKIYRLAKNLDPHHLHGGVEGFDKKVWQVTAAETKTDAVALTLSLFSADGDESYPGNVTVTVEYSLNNENELSIRYQANTDKATPLSLTNHTYFNLNGFNSDILDHSFQIHSDRFLTPDNTGMPDGQLSDVKGSATDFNQLKRMREAFVDLPNGFEHFYVFDNEERKLKNVATVVEPTSGRTLEVFTTEPGTLLYTGRYTSDKLKREDGTQYGQFRAFCFETSKYPNGPNIKDSPRSILRPGETYDETTVFKFSW